MDEQLLAPEALFVLGHQNTNWQGVQAVILPPKRHKAG